MIKTKVDFWWASFYPANQSNLKGLLKALIAGKMPALQKSHFCFDHVNRLIMFQLESNMSRVQIQKGSKQ